MQCTAKSKQSGAQCRNQAINGTTKCRMHGGASLAGVASPTFKTGRYSKFLPERLAGKYAEALADQNLLALRDEIALVGTRLGELVARLDTGESERRWQLLQDAYADLQAATRQNNAAAFKTALAQLGAALDAGGQEYALWREIAELTEQRRRLVDSEHKRLVSMQQMISTEQAVVLLAAITDIIRRNVADPQAVAVISTELRALTVVGHDAGA
jgi:hypothetical protein